MCPLGFPDNACSGAMSRARGQLGHSTPREHAQHNKHYQRPQAATESEGTQTLPLHDLTCELRQNCSKISAQSQQRRRLHINNMKYNATNNNNNKTTTE